MNINPFTDIEKKTTRIMGEIAWGLFLIITFPVWAIPYCVIKIIVFLFY